MTKFGPKLAFLVNLGQAMQALFGALLVGRLAVVARGLYLARHLFTLYIILLLSDKILDNEYYYTYYPPGCPRHSLDAAGQNNLQQE